MVEHARAVDTACLSREPGACTRRNANFNLKGPPGVTWRLLARMLGSPLACACELPHEREQWPIGAEHLRRESRSTSELGP